ncbi:MAG: dihydrolipoamide acetyltransferase family protein [Flavobacteriaceae bacterium]
MGQFLLKLPSMGESVAEATVTRWLKQVGDPIALDDSVLEIATDKVDSDVPSEVEGTLLEIKVQENEVAQVGEVLAIIETSADGDVAEEVQPLAEPEKESEVTTPEELPVEVEAYTAELQSLVAPAQIESTPITDSSRYYSPLVKNIAQKEGISLAELDQIMGTGKAGRVTKKDILAFLEDRSSAAKPSTPQRVPEPKKEKPKTILPTSPEKEREQPAPQTGEKIIPMDRMGQMIAEHMIESLKTSAHVQSLIEVDVTDLWDWREKVKGQFLANEGEKLTFTPLFMHAVIQALKAYPLLNSSVSGTNIIQKKDINLGMATALPDGNLIVPVIKNADHLNLVGLAKAVNDLSQRARSGNLLPDDVQGGTYTMTNVGNFGALTGTPIINQPQVGILAIGVIRKVPAVIETPDGDFIGIRKKMMLCHSFDHRIVNGAQGGLFAKHVADILEQWDTSLYK